MPVLNRIADRAEAIAAWRRDFHENPELLFDVHRTAGVVAQKLRDFGCDEVVEGVGQTGVIGVIKGRETGSGKVIGLRADMDALPIMEETGKPWASKTPGVMHACGHDGHTAMLLGAAQHIAETRNFDGAVALLFQPAEEGGGGGREMVKDGALDRFGVQEVFAMHNMPGLPVGQFATRTGPIMAAADFLDITLEGLGGHAARPHACIDANVVAAHLLTALQSVVSRNVNPLESAVVSITAFQSEGDAYNVIPQRVRFKGTVRTLDRAVQAEMEPTIRRLVEHVAAAFGAQGALDYRPNYPVTVNAGAQAEFAAQVAREIAGEGRVQEDTPPLMGAEDFSFMLNERPGAYLFIGNGDTAGVHHPAYDFDDSAIPFGASFWTRLVERAMPVSG